MEKQYFWKCPECGTEQKVLSVFFETDCGSSEKCSKCGKRIVCYPPATPFKKKEGQIIAYSK